MPSIPSAILLLLTVLVIFVNGWTDAPNAITCAVSCRALSFAQAVRIAAAGNLLGIMVMGWLCPAITDTMTTIAQFDPIHPAQAIAALCAAMSSIILFAVTAWRFGLPTSESHALIAALTGAAFALGGTASIDAAAWSKVLWGLSLSLVLGIFTGFGLTRLLSRPLRRCSAKLLRRIQILATAGMAFTHGAQDGLKFIAVLVTVDRLAHGQSTTATVDIRAHGLIFFLCAATMALGTCTGGRRIVQTVGEQMVSLRREQGVCADLAGGFCLLIASLAGIPMSTTHTKTTAMMGAGFACNRSGIDFTIIRHMITAWALTFPACGILGFLLTHLFLSLS